MTREHGRVGYSVQVLDRAFRILESLAERPSKVNDISVQLGLHRATVFRLLVNLRDRGYVRKDDATGMYSLGRQLFRLGTKALGEELPIHELRPRLQELAMASGHTAQLWLRSGREALCVDQAESPQNFRVVGRVGWRLPLSAGAVGKVLLAFATPTAIEEFLGATLSRITPRTVAEANMLRAKLPRVRKQGWWFSPTELTVPSWALAAPIHNALSVIELCVCVLGMGPEPSEVDIRHLARAVVAVARSISQMLGYRPVIEIRQGATRRVGRPG